MPSTKAFRRSIFAASKVIPWLLWTVIAHASRSGTCEILARFRSPSLISHVSGAIITSRPFLNSTIGYSVSGSNPTTIPILPLAYFLSSEFFTAITNAPFLSTNTSGANTERRKLSTYTFEPVLDCAYECSSSSISLSLAAFMPSTSIFTV